MKKLKLKYNRNLKIAQTADMLTKIFEIVFSIYGLIVIPFWFKDIIVGNYGSNFFFISGIGMVTFMFIIATTLIIAEIAETRYYRFRNTYNVRRLKLIREIVHDKAV